MLVLNGMVGSRDLTFFAGRGRLAHECVTCCVSILFEVQPNLQLSGKVLTLFQHLAKDPQLLQWLRDEFELHSALAEFFQNRAIEDNVPMQLQDLIKRLTSYYGLALRSNTDVEDMKKAVMATFHNVSSTDAEPHQELCPSGARSWCRHRAAEAEGKPQLPHTYNLPNKVVEALRPVYQRLSDLQLQARCSGNKTQNAAESLHSMFSQSMKQTLQVLLCTVVASNLAARKIATDIIEDLLNHQERRACVLK
ncbi:hypothetical protein HPB52_020273 [Rhipicephalus sanguineus]|uniref:Uncharacterized protein n=1 Tax=Rhipicephalus sanguineus TaxID=34632 RepID=A0A9D4SQR6_RHISA|nr:hypothetical protein HPB52_020273 [Rhipicephalus sanguineus]